MLYAIISVAGYIDDSTEHLNTNQPCSSQLNGWYFGAGAAVVGTLVYPPGGLVLSVALLTSRLCLSSLFMMNQIILLIMS